MSTPAALFVVASFFLLRSSSDEADDLVSSQESCPDLKRGESRCTTTIASTWSSLADVSDDSLRLRVLALALLIGVRAASAHHVRVGDLAVHEDLPSSFASLFALGV